MEGVQCKRVARSINFVGLYVPGGTKLRHLKVTLVLKEKDNDKVRSKRILEHIEGVVVYLDAGTTKSFQFVGAYPVLLELGARAICSLENMCALDAIDIWSLESLLLRWQRGSLHLLIFTP
ncbi:hypothetical protein RJT34_16731 [Clitoria ternatea]|uniref:Uncharacterized protein n=1 Tax=Clitoria ternatea TaxID=43366 RepID=A0AAN9PDX6_CLITE